jgi:hypothetical protein
MVNPNKGKILVVSVGILVQETLPVALASIKLNIRQVGHGISTSGRLDHSNKSKPHFHATFGTLDGSKVAVTHNKSVSVCPWLDQRGQHHGAMVHSCIIGTWKKRVSQL